MSTSQVNHLIVIVYAYSVSDSIFSHQRDLCNSLSARFEKVTIIADTYDGSPLPKNLKVLVLSKGRKRRFWRFFRLMFFLFSILVRQRSSVLFSFMTETHSIFASLIAKSFGCRHVLWYAHASSPVRLRIAISLVDTIVSSTEGSLTLQTPKLKLIGQGIDEEMFFFRPENRIREKWVHWGRLDESKHILELCQVVTNVSTTWMGLSLTLIGSSTSHQNSSYVSKIRYDFTPSLKNGTIEFLNSVPRTELARVSARSYGFIHSFNGSLDKSLLEAVFLGIHVVTTNQEFIREFGTLQDRVSVNSLGFLEAELLEAINMTENQSLAILNARLEIAKQNHSFRAWEEEVWKILTDGGTNFGI